MESKELMQLLLKDTLSEEKKKEYFDKLQNVSKEYMRKSQLFIRVLLVLFLTWFILMFGSPEGATLVGLKIRNLNIVIVGLPAIMMFYNYSYYSHILFVKIQERLLEVYHVSKFDELTKKDLMVQMLKYPTIEIVESILNFSSNRRSWHDKIIWIWNLLFSIVVYALPALIILGISTYNLIYFFRLEGNYATSFYFWGSVAALAIAILFLIRLFVLNKQLKVLVEE